GGRESFGDIYYTPEVGAEIAQRFGGTVRDTFVNKLGYHFEVPQPAQ
ncbi:MAG: hypothetical protein JNM79_18290, partial [Burkholderiales bacterium]|nr:hypothetical protein [Burkholderiales bacterium]